MCSPIRLGQVRLLKPAIIHAHSYTLLYLLYSHFHNFLFLEVYFIGTDSW